VRPGITGLAQVVLRSEGTEDDRRALDLRYVREHGVWLDLKILAATVGRLTGRGAN
jgi:lipopolysaccharide/colanic/teichoic acid biosynthesis glycosyltransferase